MYSLWMIAGAVGLREGLNPCTFLSCAALVTLGQCLDGAQANWLRLAYVLIYGLGFLFFDFGSGQALVLKPYFLVAGKYMFMVLGLAALVLGVQSLMAWFQMHQAKTPSQQKILKPNASAVWPWFVYAATAASAVLLSALATFAPVNKYILVLGNEAMLKGQWKEVLPVLGGYTLFMLWPLWILCSFLSIKGLQATMRKIVSASIYFTASTCVIFIF